MASRKSSGEQDRKPEIASQSDDPEWRALVAELAREAPLDAQRVAQLRASIANGTYSSDPAQISKKLLELESRLFPEPADDDSDADSKDVGNKKD